MAKDTSWLRDRQRHIGGSDIGVLLGLNPYRTPVELYLDKIGEGKPFKGNVATRRGQMLEPLVAQLYEERTGYTTMGQEDRMYAVLDEEYEFLSCTPDRLAFSLFGQLVLEIKTGVGEALRHWGASSFEASSSDDTDYVFNQPYAGVPSMYYVQLQQNMHVMSYHINDLLKYGDIAALLDDQLHTYRFMINPPLIEDIRFIAFDFWNNNVLKRIPPSPQQLKDYNLTYKTAVDGSLIEAEPDLVLELVRYEGKRQEIRDAETAIKEAKAELEATEGRVRRTMRDNSMLVKGDIVLATYNNTSDKTVFDAELFRTEHPDLYKYYCRPVPGSRRLLIKHKNIGGTDD